VEYESFHYQYWFSSQSCGLLFFYDTKKAEINETFAERAVSFPAQASSPKFQNHSAYYKQYSSTDHYHIELN